MLRRRTPWEQEQAARKVEWLSTPLERFIEWAGETFSAVLQFCLLVPFLPVLAYVKLTWRAKQ